MMLVEEFGKLFIQQRQIYEGTQTFVGGLHCMDVKLSDRSSNDVRTRLEVQTEPCGR
jgi:hypothetical protein